MISIGVVGRTLLSDSLDTQCAPSSTHRLINSTSAIVNRSPLGGMISDGRGRLDDAPWVSLIPAAVMFLTVLSFNLVGDRFRRVFDVRAGAI